MAKVNVSLPDDLLARVDGLAAELGRSRSGFVAEATARYAATLEDERAERERAERIRAAMASMRDISTRVPPGRPMVDIIREDRDTDHGRLPRRKADS